MMGEKPFTQRFDEFMQDLGLFSEPEEPVRCPECGSEDLAEDRTTYGTGVVAPDGVEETTTEDFVHCGKCGADFAPDDLLDRQR